MECVVCRPGTLCRGCVAVAAGCVAEMLDNYGTARAKQCVADMYPGQYMVVLSAALASGLVCTVPGNRLCHTYAKVLLEAAASTGVTSTVSCTSAHNRFIHRHHSKHGLYFNNRHNILKCRSALNMFNRRSIIRGINLSFPRGICMQSIVSEYDSAYLDVYALVTDGTECFESGGTIWSRKSL